MSTASINGVPIVGSAVWQLTRGVRPFSAAFDVPAGLVDRALEGSATGWSVLDLDGMRIEKLRVVGTTAGRTPGTVGVVVADRRYEWARRHVEASFNVRRRGGETRSVGVGRMQTRAAVADVDYFPWTLNEGGPWKAEEILEEVLRIVLREPTGGGFDVSAVGRRWTGSIEVENLELQHPGDAAIQVCLQLIAGFDITVDPDGTVVVYDTMDVQQEENLLRTAGPNLIRGGLWARSDKSNSRPAFIEVMFERECEILFTYQEPDGANRTLEAAGADPNDRSRELINVFETVKQELKLPNGETVGQRSIVDRRTILGAWRNDHPPQISGVPAFSDLIIRRHYMGSFKYLENIYAIDTAGNTDPIWVSRLRETRHAWRLKFAIPPNWADRASSVRAQMASYLDPEYGIRAQSAVWMDYVAKAAPIGLAKSRTNYHRCGWVVKIDLAQLSSSVANPRAPMIVQMINEDVGVFQLRFARDQAGEAEEIAPGRVENLDKLPSVSAAEALATYHASELTPEFKLAVILSLVQGSPNDQGRLHVEQINPGDVEEILGMSVGPCNGPPMEVRVGATAITARYAWSDQYAQEIETAWFEGGELPDALLVNATELRWFALAEAARIYAQQIDRVEGRLAVPINPGLVVRGGILSVTHRVTRESQPLSEVVMAQPAPPADPMAFIPRSIQRAIRRLAQP